MTGLSYALMAFLNSTLSQRRSVIFDPVPFSRTGRSRPRFKRGKWKGHHQQQREKGLR